jgi:sarcosine oxidase subunit delta
MSFLIPCPNCGPRSVHEYSTTGEVTTRPKSSPTLRELTSYLYFRKNVAGVQREWWFHRDGCELWFQGERDTRTNEVLKTWIPAPGPAPAELGASDGSTAAA